MSDAHLAFAISVTVAAIAGGVVSGFLLIYLLRRTGGGE